MSPETIPPGSTIGILGGGQLGRMLAQAAATMGYHTHIYCPDQDSPAFEVSAFHTIAAYDDVKALQKFAQSVAVVTYEFENIPAAPVAALDQITVRPHPDILALSQHRVREKEMLNAIDIKTAPFAAVTSLDELKAATSRIGLPAVLKTARMGYDGKGQVMLDEKSDVPASWKNLNTREAILEGFIHFRMEISVIVARDLAGNMECFDVVQNIHKNHILSQTIVPAPIPAALAKKAQEVARAIADNIKLVGIMAVEMFVTDKEELLVNELAPRPHNSGHWTLDACVTSQFEQTIRAICGLPLGSTRRLSDAKMLNLIGPDVHDWPRYAKDPHAKVHLYGKKEIRAGRKMGHVTFLDLKANQ